MEGGYNFNLCDIAAMSNRWDIVKLAMDHGCSFEGAAFIDIEHFINLTSTQNHT